MKRIEDPVHGLMEFRAMQEFAVDLLRARELQRLRRIRQLGLASLVYPGADHSRFAHSLGAACVTSQFAAALQVSTQHSIAGALQIDDEVSRDLVVAALVHDAGHGPLSHVWERHVVRDFDLQKHRQTLGVPPKQWITESTKWHELVTQAFLLSDESDLNQRLEQLETGAAERIAGLVAGHYYIPHLARLFDSDVDVDRCDFVIRDAHHTGVAYGRFDLQWLVSTVTVGFNDKNTPILGFDASKAPRAVEQLLIARRALYNTVYFHRSIRGAERMMGKLLERLAENHEGDLGKIEKNSTTGKAFAAGIRREPLTLREVRSLDDFGLQVIIAELAETATDSAVANLAGKLAVRDLLKPLPLMGARLDEFMFEHGENALEMIYTGVKAAGYKTPEAFVALDRESLSFFEGDNDRAAYFIDTATSGAQAISEHPELAHYRSDEQVFHWAFVPADAVRPVMKMIGPRA